MTENAARENDGPICGHEHDGPGREIAGEKSTVLTEITLQ